jgi:hypothetical protein
MTEAEWLTATDSTLMLECLNGETSDRKFRLFGVSCCRHIWHLFTDIRWQEAIKTAEKYADGIATVAEFNLAGENARAASWDAEMGYVNGTNEAFLAEVAEQKEGVSVESMIAAVLVPVGIDSAFAAVFANYSGKQSSNQIALLHDIFGNPFRPITLNPSWLTATVLALATGIYEEKAFDSMPILADALPDAGCDNEDILNHCRQPDEHVKGCWVLDLLLGKS